MLNSETSLGELLLDLPRFDMSTILRFERFWRCFCEESDGCMRTVLNFVVTSGDEHEAFLFANGESGRRAGGYC